MSTKLADRLELHIKRWHRLPGEEELLEIVSELRREAQERAEPVNAELLAALRLWQAAEQFQANCPDCDGNGCGTCFPSIDDARIAMRNAISRAESAAVVERADISRELAEALGEYYAGALQIDNGRCAICKCGYRTHIVVRGKLKGMTDCSNEFCVTRKIDTALAHYRATQPAEAVSQTPEPKSPGCRCRFLSRPHCAHCRPDLFPSTDATKGLLDALQKIAERAKPRANKKPHPDDCWCSGHIAKRAIAAYEASATVVRKGDQK